MYNDKYRRIIVRAGSNAYRFRISLVPRLMTAQVSWLGAFMIEKT